MPNLSKNETLPYTATPSRQPATKGAARNFAARILLFLLPILLSIGIVELALWQTGETMPMAMVIERQQKNPKLFWLRAYFDQAPTTFKKYGLEVHRPGVVALGSSRVLKFRSEMLGRDGENFYNAGGLIQSVEDLNSFAEALTPENTPRVALIGVDSWWLNESWLTSSPPSQYEDGVFDWRAHWLVWREMLTKSRKGKPSPLQNLLRAWRSPNYKDGLGIQARIRGSGLRNDGSKSNRYKVPAHISDWKIGDDRWKKRISEGEGEGVFTPGVSRARLARLRHALMTLQAKGVTILLFNPPLISYDASLMNSIPEQHRFWHEYQTLVPQLCRELKIPFCDASTPQKLGLADYYMADEVHAEETFHLYVLRSWMKDPAARQALPDVPKIVKALLASPHTHFWDPDYSALPS